MTRNTACVTVTVDAPPEKVFAVLCDVERWPEWTSTMAGVERLESGPFAVGSSARVRQPKLRPAVWQVTRFENQRNFTWATRSPGLRMTAAHSIEPEGEGSRVTLSFELSGFIAPLVSRLYGGLIQRYITTEAQGLKKRSESATWAMGASAVDPGNR
ncbi:MAG TPA: SRPBCC family protein [Steroidobacteraceae bacterium]